MYTTTRTTVRIRADLFDQFRLLALQKGTSLQDIINTTLALGLGKVSDLDSDKKAMAKINTLRTSLIDKNVSLEDLLAERKSDLK